MYKVGACDPVDVVNVTVPDFRVLGALNRWWTDAPGTAHVETADKLRQCLAPLSIG